MTTYTSQPAEAAATDTTIELLAPTVNFGTGGLLGVGNNEFAGNETWRTLIKFDLSSIPQTAYISSATLTLTISADKAQNARDFKMYRILRDWIEIEATWNQWKNGNAWTTAGCGSNGNDADLTNVWATCSMGTADSGTKNFVFSATGLAELTKMVFGTYTNYGWLIKADTEANDAYEFCSSSNATSGNRPLLTIEYAYAGLSAIWTSE
jgi:hypothetical protein